MERTANITVAPEFGSVNGAPGWEATQWKPVPASSSAAATVGKAHE